MSSIKSTIQEGLISEAEYQITKFENNIRDHKRAIKSMQERQQAIRLAMDYAAERENYFPIKQALNHADVNARDLDIPAEYVARWLEKNKATQASTV